MDDMALSRRLEERRGAVLRLLKPTVKKTYKRLVNLRGVKLVDLKGVKLVDLKK